MKTLASLFLCYILAATFCHAQTTSYSINLQPGDNFIANQLDHGSNTLTEVLSGVADGTILYKYNNASRSWSSSLYNFAQGWVPNNITLAPGEGAILQSPNYNSLYFTGTPHVPVLPATLSSGAYSLLSRQTNDIGSYTNIVGAPPTNGARIYKWNASAQGYDTYSFSSNSWSPFDPALNVGESAWVLPNGGPPPPLPTNYSVNVTAGTCLIANQLDHGSNTLNEVLPVVPDGTMIFKYSNTSNATWSVSIYNAGLGSWLPNNITPAPGEGAVMQSPSYFILTFTGTPHVPVLPVSIPSGACYLLGRQTNDVGNYATIVGTPPIDGTTLYKWNGSGYDTSIYSGGNWSSYGSDGPPTAVGEAVWISPSGAPIPPLPTYYPVTVPAGLSLIANQLDHGSNRLSDVLPVVPDGTILFKYSNTSNATWSASVYNASLGSWLPNVTLAPGEGAILQSSVSFTVAFTGTPHVPVLPVTIPSGACYLLSRQTNDVGDYADITGTPPINGATIYKWNGSSYDTYTYSGGTWSSGGSDGPMTTIGEAVWISPSGAPLPTLPLNYPVTVPAGTSLIANQLDHGSNTLNEVLPAVPDGTALFKYNTNGTWSASTYNAGLNSWLPNNITLAPGEGAILKSPAAFTVAFTGVPHVSVLPVTVPNGASYLLSRQTNDVGDYADMIGVPPLEGSTLYKWNSSNYLAYTYSGGTWSGGGPDGPIIDVGEAVWISPSGAAPPPLPANYPLNIPAGTYLIANQLDHGSNTLNEVLPAAPDGTVLFKYSNTTNGTWSASVYNADLGSWLPNNITLKPGEGAVLQSPASFKVMFTGTPHVPVLPVSIPSGACYLLSRQTNDVGNYINIVGTSPPRRAMIYQWNGVSYTGYIFIAGAWSSGGSNGPTTAVGEAVWISPSGAPMPTLPTNYSVTIPAGTSLIANQLDHGSNTLNEVLPGVPDGTVLFKYNTNTTWSVATYNASIGSWLPGNITLKPGEGAVLQSPVSFTVAFTGTPHVPVLPVSIPNGFCFLLSRQTNDVGNYANIIGTPPVDGATIYQWSGSSYNTFTYSGGTWSGSDSNGPVSQVGEALWISPSGAPLPTLPINYPVTVPAGGALIANQLDHGSNTLNEVLPAVPDGTVLSKYDNASGTWITATYSASTTSWSPNITLNPGDGAYILGPVSFSVSFTGTPHVPVLPVTIPGGAYYLLSCQTNDIGSYDNIVGSPASDGAAALVWNGSDLDAYSNISGLWYPATPSVNVGQAVWIASSAPASPPPNPFLMFNGKINHALGGASINTQSGVAVIGNIGSSGQDGVEIAMGAAQQAGALCAVDDAGTALHAVDDASTALGATLQYVVNGSTNGTGAHNLLVSIQTTKMASANYAITVNLSPLGTNHYTLEVLNGTNVLGAVDDASTAMCAVAWFPTDFRSGWDDNGFFVRLHWPDGPVTIALTGGPTVTADTLVLRPAGGGPLSGSISSEQLLAKLVPQLAIYTEDQYLNSSGALHQPLGNATLSPVGNQITVHNIGANGQDGVQMAPNFPSGEVNVVDNANTAMNTLKTISTTLNAVDDANTAMNAMIQFTPSGHKGGTGTNSPLGSVQMTKLAAANYQVAVDFSVFGTNRYMAAVANGTNVVYAVDDASTAMCYVPAFANQVQSGWDTTGFYIQLGWSSGPINVQINGGPALTGDNIILRPDYGPPTGSISRMTLLAANLSQLTITNETVSPLQLKNRVSGKNFAFHWVGNGFLQSSTNLTGWSDASGLTNSFVAPANLPHQFFRVRQ